VSDHVLKQNLADAASMARRKWDTARWRAAPWWHPGLGVEP
jgi:hypothetical protein